MTNPVCASPNCSNQITQCGPFTQRLCRDCTAKKAEEAKKSKS